VVDFVVVLAPLQFLAVWLFLATAGHVQMDGGVIREVRCEPVSALPENLNPEPPDNWNVAVDCWTRLFGAPTAHALTVARAITIRTSAATVTQTVSRRYTLDAKGAVIDAFSLDLVAFAALALYLVGMKGLRGQSLGDRLVRVRLVDVADPSRVGAPVWKVILRYLAMAIGLLPGAAWLGWLAIEYRADAWVHQSARASLVCIGLFVVWMVANIVLIARKLDPIYDRICGLSVHRLPTLAPEEPPLAGARINLL
jgi:hypothetical protein